SSFGPRPATPPDVIKHFAGEGLVRAVFAGLDERIKLVRVIRQFVCLENNEFPTADNHSRLAFDCVVSQFAQLAFGFADRAGFHTGLILDSFWSGVNQSTVSRLIDGSVVGAGATSARRLAACRSSALHDPTRFLLPTSCRLEIGDTAGWKPAPLSEAVARHWLNCDVQIDKVSDKDINCQAR